MMLQQAWAFLTDPAQWTGADGVGVRLGEHLAITAVAMLFAMLIAIPVGLMIGHSGRGRVAVVGVSGALRALPSLGLLTILALWLPNGVGRPEIPATIVLVILAIPPILAGAYAGVEAIPAEITQSARAVGHTEWQVLSQVEVPLACASIFDGIRSATLQVIATATLCSYLGLGGLGRYLLDGLATRDYPMVLAGAITVIALALLVEGLLAAVGALVLRRAISPSRTVDEENASRTETATVPFHAGDRR